jgi:hypothetical protein
MSPNRCWRKAKSCPPSQPHRPMPPFAAMIWRPPSSLTLRGPPPAYLPKKRPYLFGTIILRRDITLSSVTLTAHGSSLIGGSAKLTTPVDRSSYLARAIYKLLRPHSTTRARPEISLTDSSAHPLIMISPTTTATDLKPTSQLADSGTTTLLLWRKTPYPQI